MNADEDRNRLLELCKIYDEENLEEEELQEMVDLIRALDEAMRQGAQLPRAWVTGEAS